jgi:non-specific serine/threonine protein kinase
MDLLSPSSSQPTVLRKFGRFELRQLLGKSVATMTWRVFDPQAQRELMLTLPREQPSDAVSLDRWLLGVTKAARLDHPYLARVVEIGVHDHWPFVAVDRACGVTLGEWRAAHPSSTPAEAVDIMIRALQGLAFAHDAGVAHLDVQLHTLLVDEQSQPVWMALGAADAGKTGPFGDARNAGREGSLQQLAQQRADAQRDLLACGLLIHGWLAGQSALDEPDLARAAARLPPLGHEVIRLPWTTPQLVPDALRAIVNRCTASQECHRYHSTRTLLRALEGWRQAQAADAGGPLGLLLDRLHSVGHLPAIPGLAGRVARMTSLEGQHADEMAEQVLQDMALSLELLRLVNSAQVRGSLLSGSGPILAIRRSIALLGVDGVRRAANALRLWPGPLQSADAGAMRRLIDQVRLAGFAAQALRPAGYDPEVVYLVVVLQNLGRLLVQYHFPEEAEQIRALMEPVPAAANAEPGTPGLPGLTEEAAANAVLGVDLDSLQAAVVRHWGLGDEVLHMIRPLPDGKAVRMPDSDADVLRATASAANELADAIKLRPPQQAAAAVAQVATRYARALKISSRDVRDALQSARSAVRDGAAVAMATPPLAPAGAGGGLPDRTVAEDRATAAVAGK